MSLLNSDYVSRVQFFWCMRLLERIFSFHNSYGICEYGFHNVRTGHCLPMVLVV